MNAQSLVQNQWPVIDIVSYSRLSSAFIARLVSISEVTDLYLTGGETEAQRC